MWLLQTGMFAYKSKCSNPYLPHTIVTHTGCFRRNRGRLGQETRTAPNLSAQAKLPRETESAGFETEGTRAYHDIVLLSASAHTDKRIKSRDGREELAALIRPSLSESLSTKTKSFRCNS